MPVLMLPVGLGYDPLDWVVLDPDARVQRSIRMLFDTFARTGSARSTVRYLRSEGLDVPRRPHREAEKGQLRWQPATHSYVLGMLHNPRYAGAYAYGRRRNRRRPDGSVRAERMPIREWTVLLGGHRPLRGQNESGRFILCTAGSGVTRRGGIGLRGRGRSRVAIARTRTDPRGTRRYSTLLRQARMLGTPHGWRPPDRTP